MRPNDQRHEFGINLPPPPVWCPECSCDGGVVMSGGGQRRRFCLVLVKPSHYDDDGYVIQWFRSAIPSNSLAAVYGIAKQLADEQRARARHRHRHPRHRRDQQPRPHRPHREDDQGRRRRHGHAGRRAVEPVAAHARPVAAAARAGHPGRHRRLPCVGHDLHARRQRQGAEGRAGARHLDLRRRGRRPARRGAARRRTPAR